MPAPKRQEPEQTPAAETPQPETTQQEMFKQLMQTPAGAVLSDQAAFNLVERAAKKYAASTIVPKAFQGNEPNCFIATQIALRLRMEPIQVMQSMYVVYGTPGWLATFYIAGINTCGRFVPGSLDYVITGEGMQRSCRATAISKVTNKTVVGSPVDMQMAKAEGWLDKPGSKWRTMPDHMLRFRSAAFFAREFVPETTLGMPMSDEMGDIFDVDPKTGEVKPKSGVAGAKEMLAGNAAG